MSRNAFNPLQPQQRALGVAFVVLQRFGGQAGRYLMQVMKIGTNRAVARRDDLQRSVEGLGDLPQRRRPMPPLLLGHVGRRRDDRYGVGEGHFNELGCFGHWEALCRAGDGWGCL
jgi:hypothetical protein